MPRWVRVAAGVAGAGGAAALAAVALAARRWERDTARMAARLAAHQAATSGAAADGAFDPARLAELPAPVRRYLLFALAPGQPLVRGARVEHAGEFASAPGQWAPFTSTQTFTAGPPGFVWDARLRMGRVVPVRVRDGYLAGEGSVQAAAFGAVPVAGQRGTPEIAASALWRYLAESVWFPTALLPGGGVTWAAVDDSTARATLVDGAARADADFHFGPGGEVVRVTGLRYRAVGDGQVLTPTEGRHAGYRRVGGMRIPTAGSVAWLLPAGPHVYWRARLVRASYDRRRPPA